MLAFIKTWLKHVRYKSIWNDAIELIRCDPELAPRAGYRCYSSRK
jgi:hypothetical protein